MTDGSFDNPNHGEATHPTPLDGGVFASLVGIKLLLHVATGLFSPYGFHRDEFLYIAMGTHLRLWHMDFPPLIAILAKLVHALAGPSLFATRLVPAVAGTLVLVLAVLAAREMGGRRSAQLLAGLAVLCTPLFLRSANLFQPVVLDQLWWTLGLFALLRLRNSGEQRWWIVLGVAGGLGLLTKFSILFFGLAMLIGLLLTPNRRAFMTRWPWLAIGIALVIGAPSIVGQITLGFPVLGQMRVLSGTQLARTTTAEFILGQVLWGPGVVLAGMAGGIIAVLLMRRNKPVALEADASELDSVRNELRVLSSSAVGMGQRLERVVQELQGLRERQERLESRESAGTAYGQAIRMAERGKNVDELVETFGVSRAEAELMRNLHPEMKPPRRRH